MTSINSRKGFTILETMVAIAILLIAVTGPLSTISSALGQIYTARDQMIAISLAQEGIEKVRQMRDSNMIANWGGPATPWGGLSLGGYVINKNFQLQSCLAADCSSDDVRVYKNATDYYQGGASDGIATQFSRVISIEGGDDTQRKVTSTVTWKTSANVSKTVVLTEYLFALNVNQQ